MTTVVRAEDRAGDDDTAASTDAAPVFLVGAARSGTSLLYKVMALHPGATWLSNWVARFPAAPQLTALNRLARALPQRRTRVWFGSDRDNAYVYGSRRPLRDRLFPMPHEAEPFYARSGIPERLDADTDLDEASRRLRSRFATVSRWDRGRTVLSKRIANNRRIPLLAHAFPQARFIEIRRDGRAVAASLARVDWWETSPVWWYGDTPRAWRLAGGDPWELCARNWVEDVRSVREGLAGVAAERVNSLTYEDLVRDPAHVINQTLGFCDLDTANASWRQALRQVRFPNLNQRWHTVLSGADRAVVERVQHEELARYGYC